MMASKLKEAVRATSDHTGTVDNSETGQDVARNFEAKKAGCRKLIAKVEGKDNGTVPIKVTPLDDGTYAVTFNPKFPNIYTIAVSWDKEDVVPANKVETVNPPALLPGEPEATLLVERRKNAIEITVGTPVKLNVQPNDDTQRNGTLTARVQGEATGTANVQTTQNAKGVFEVYFNPPEPDYYVLEVKLNDEQVSQNPFHVLYIPAEPVPQVNLADSPQVADKGATKLVSQQTTRTITKQEIHKRTTIVSTPAGTTTEVNADDKMTELSNTPEEPGEYVIDIIMNSTPLPQQHAKHIIPTLASNCTASGEGLKRARVGQRAKFSVDCKQGGAGELHVIVQGPNTKLPVEREETKPQNFDVAG